jgi:hypothetical protein
MWALGVLTGTMACDSIGDTTTRLTQAITAEYSAATDDVADAATDTGAATDRGMDGDGDHPAASAGIRAKRRRSLGRSMWRRARRRSRPGSSWAVLRTGAVIWRRSTMAATSTTLSAPPCAWICRRSCGPGSDCLPCPSWAPTMAPAGVACARPTTTAATTAPPCPRSRPRSRRIRPTAAWDIALIHRTLQALRRQRRLRKTLR